MKHITPEQREEAFQSAPLIIQELYNSVTTGNKLREVFSAHQLEEGRYASYALVVGNGILGFYPISELSSELQSALRLDVSTAESVALPLTEYLLPSLNAVRGTAITQSSTEDTDASSATQRDEPTVQPLRTMEADVDRIHGYGAYEQLHGDATQAANNQSEATAPPSWSSDEQVVHATPQDEIQNKNTLTQLPKYADEESGAGQQHPST